MNILMPQASRDRLHEAIAATAPQATVVTMRKGGRLTATGHALDPAATRVEIVWLNRDVARAGLTDRFFDFAQKPGARWVQTSVTGLDDPRYHGILQGGAHLTNSDAQAVAIAQYVMAEVIAEYSALSVLRAQQSLRTWARLPFREVSGTTWLIIGFGHIGHEVARRARSFGARILGIRQHPIVDEDADRVGTLDDLYSFLPQADVVLLSCTLTPKTRYLADARFFSAMKPGAILINVARGAIIAEPDLLAALDEGKPASAILDVFAQEPLPQDSPFWSHPGVRLSPHNSANGDRTSERGDLLFLKNLRRFVNDEPLLNQVRSD
jgi:phosphoglycerate dehydrogenase-like enzyme